MKKFALNNAFFKDGGANESENVLSELLASVLKRSTGTDNGNTVKKPENSAANRNKNAILAELYPESDDPRPLNGEESFSEENINAISQSNAVLSKNANFSDSDIAKNADLHKNTDRDGSNHGKDCGFSQNSRKQDRKTVEDPGGSSDKRDKNGKDRSPLQKDGRKVSADGANTRKKMPNDTEKDKKSGENDYFSPPPYYKLP